MLLSSLFERKIVTPTLLKVINVSCIRIVIICIGLLYTNKIVRLYYTTPTMRNDSETVIMTIARACLEESFPKTAGNDYKYFKSNVRTK
jgi:hypothetical protein